MPKVINSSASRKQKYHYPKRRLDLACHIVHTDRTNSCSGLRPVSHADFFVPAHSGCIAHNGRDDRPNTIPPGNKVSRLQAVVESCPPSYWRVNTKLVGGSHA